MISSLMDAPFPFGGGYMTTMAHCDAVRGGGIQPINSGSVQNDTLSFQNTFPVVA